jgi:uncharacterized protein (DUF433 family)
MVITRQVLAKQLSEYLQHNVTIEQLVDWAERRTPRLRRHTTNPSRRYTRRHRTMTMPTKASVVHSDPEILSGTPVFVGTRVPVQSLFDYLEGGDTLDEFLRQFPSVRRDQAIAALELARDSVMTSARPA